MIAFFRKNSYPLTLKVDIHSHLLPGIDDGASSEKEAIALIEELMQLGFRAAITTPHILPGYYNNNEKTIQNAYNRIKSLIPKGFQLHWAAEYYLEDSLLEATKNDKPLLTFSSPPYLLFELPMLVPPNQHQLQMFLYLLRRRGIYPVLAHPERYLYCNKPWLQALKEEYQVHFQLNWSSFAGRYGEPVRKMAIEIAKELWVDFLGSDTHHSAHIDAIRQVLSRRSLAKLLLEDNPLQNNLLLDVS